MSSFARRLAVLCALLALLGAVPRHVQTADYYAGYAGTKTVPPSIAARWLSWAETDAPGSRSLAGTGVRPIMYTNPNRIAPSDSMYADNDALFAHTCSGQRARGESGHAGILLSDPRSTTLVAAWRKTIQEHAEGGHFDAIFADDAVGDVYAQDQPCGYNIRSWLQGENQLFAGAGYPIIYNGLNYFTNRTVAPEIVLNQHAVGGMMEECYARLSQDHRVGGDAWFATEKTEIEMAREHKYFFCYGRDLTPAEQAYDGRLYTYASFLLTYDPGTSVLWEYYKTPSNGHVMPESQLVALDPVRQAVPNVDVLRTADGVYQRAYSACYMAGRPVGPCVVAVNPDTGSAHPLNLSGYRRTLALHGSGVFDGGTSSISSAPPPSQLQPLGAVIAFK